MKKVWIVRCRKCKNYSQMYPDFEKEKFQEKATCNFCGAEILYSDGKWFSKTSTETKQHEELDLLAIEQ